MSKIISTINGTAVPIYGNDIDTDRIIPARFLKVLTFEKMGEYVFADVRFDEAGEPLDHPTNDPRFKGASIMVVQKNFGCGSSREHAAQAIKRFGIKAIIGESFSEIFSGNCKAIGVPIVTASEDVVAQLLSYIEENPSTSFHVDLDTKKVTADGFSIDVDLPESRRQSFLTGSWDVVSLLLEDQDALQRTYNKLPYVHF